MSRFKVLDYIFFLIFTALVIFSVQYYAEGRKGKSYAEINASGQYYLLPLDTDREITVKGPAGETHITISKGSAYISHSDCPNKTCVASGSISKPGAWAACMPNKIFVQITTSGNSPEKGNVDAGAF